jgi:AhpD family alkylhydroperoxidase
MAEALDSLTKELVGIAAAVAGHCQPCFAYHYKEALAAGASLDAIQASVELARAVRSAGDRQMDELVSRRMAGELVGAVGKGMADAPT